MFAGKMQARAVKTRRASYDILVRWGRRGNTRYPGELPQQGEYVRGSVRIMEAITAPLFDGAKTLVVHEQSVEHETDGDRKENETDDA